MKSSLSIAICVLLAFASAGVAFATTVVKMDFDQLVAASDLIVIGHVSSVKGVVDRGRVYTHVSVKVDETLKGDPRAELEIIHIGGRTDRLVTRVSGMPDFTVGEHTLLFLEQPPSVKHFVVTGLAQGKMAIDADEQGKLLLRPSTVPQHTVRPVQLPTADADATPVAPAAKIESLDDARDRVKTLLAPRETAQ